MLFGALLLVVSGSLSGVWLSIHQKFESLDLSFLFGTQGYEYVELTPNPNEVAEVHRVPIAGLDAPGIPKLFDLGVSDRPVLSVRILGKDIFAPTAAVIYQFREVAIHGRDTRVAHYDQPPFAWK